MWKNPEKYPGKQELVIEPLDDVSESSITDFVLQITFFF
jgi:hypothetical protein